MRNSPPEARECALENLQMVPLETQISSTSTLRGFAWSSRAHDPVNFEGSSTAS